LVLALGGLRPFGRKNFDQITPMWGAAHFGGFRPWGFCAWTCYSGPTVRSFWGRGTRRENKLAPPRWESFPSGHLSIVEGTGVHIFPTPLVNNFFGAPLGDFPLAPRRWAAPPRFGVLFPTPLPHFFTLLSHLRFFFFGLGPFVDPGAFWGGRDPPLCGTFFQGRIFFSYSFRASGTVSVQTASGCSSLFVLARFFFPGFDRTFWPREKTCLGRDLVGYLRRAPGRSFYAVFCYGRLLVSPFEIIAQHPFNGILLLKGGAARHHPFSGPSWETRFLGLGGGFLGAGGRVTGTLAVPLWGVPLQRSPFR